MTYSLQGVKRRIIYVALYELLAIIITSVALAWSADNSMGKATALAVVSSVIAIVWNLIFNHLFEKWEQRQAKPERTVKRRVLHATGFEGGLIVAFVPLFAWWLNVSLLHAFVLDIGFLIFFLCYTFIFNWAFDILFGVPIKSEH